MQGIYNYIPQTNYVTRVYSVAVILWLQFMVHVMLFPMLNVLYLNMMILYFLFHFWNLCTNTVYVIIVVLFTTNFKFLILMLC